MEDVLVTAVGVPEMYPWSNSMTTAGSDPLVMLHELLAPPVLEGVIVLMVLSFEK